MNDEFQEKRFLERNRYVSTRQARIRLTKQLYRLLRFAALLATIDRESLKLMVTCNSSN
jgi:hypothetical protein